MPLDLPIRLRYLDLEHFKILHKSCNTGKGLPPAAAQPHEQRMAPGRRDDAAYSADVFKRELEEDKLHGLFAGGVIVT